MAPITAPNQGRAQALLASNILFLVLPFPFVALRLWARWIKKNRLSFNDYAILFALVATAGFNVNIIVATIKGGYGQHIGTLSPKELDVFQKSTIVSTLLWPTANTLVKISVLHFYKTIFRLERKMCYGVYAAGTLTLAYWLSTIITAFAICQPFAYNWNKVTIHGHCGDTVAYYLSTAIFNLLIDVIIVALPLPVLWSLHLDVTKKVSLTFIFSLGALICVISIVRCYAINNLNLLDVTYDVVLDNVCTSLEPTLGVINACLPLLQPVMSKIPQSTVVSWLRSWRSSATSRRRLGSSEGKQYTSNNQSDDFKRPSVDLYPLTDITVTHSITQHSVGEHNSSSSLGN